jgi:hypothetical protein
MAKSPSNNLEEYKIRASILHKQLRRGNPEQAQSAAQRFQRLSHLARLPVQEIVQRKDEIQRKHALAVIALENDYASWADLKGHFERLEKLAALRQSYAYTPLYPRRCAGFINDWYASHEKARTHLVRDGGYLLPYRHHFFICQRPYIEVLGLDPDDPDWERIGWDWARPADRAAWERLNARLAAYEGED